MKKTRYLVSFCFALILFAVGVRTADAATFTVNSLDDNSDGTCDGVHCSLKEAINAANANPDSDSIVFTTGAGTITQGAQYTITNPVDVDANSVGIILTKGLSTSAESSGVTIRGFTMYPGNGKAATYLYGTNNTFGGADVSDRNIIIDHGSNAGNALQIFGTNITVRNNYINVQSDGVTVDTTYTGILVQDNATGAIIKDNIITSGGGCGIQLFGVNIGTVNIVGNRIGVGANGTADLNPFVGICDRDDRTMNGLITIGGPSSDLRNIISGAVQQGIYLTATYTGGFKIENNYIGTRADGQAALANGAGGIDIRDVCNGGICIIGGPTSDHRNVISGNTTNGIAFASGVSGWKIQGNYIGLNAAGTAAIANTNNGINATAGAIANIVIGEDSPTPTSYNVISGNGSCGVQINATSASVKINGNYIGTNATGTAAVPNNTCGVRTQNTAIHVTIGNANATSPTNLVSGNNGVGLDINGTIYLYSSMVGLNLAGTGSIANTSHGVSIVGSSAQVGAGNLTNGFNVISGNGVQGLIISNMDAADSVVIAGNYIGTNKNGDAGVPNGQNGIKIAGSNAAGALTLGNGMTTTIYNIISGNNIHGISIDPGSTADINIYGSFIGTNKAGTGAVANGGVGISINNVQNIDIGNTNGTGKNIISGNVGDGIETSDNCNNTRIYGNYIGLGADGILVVGNGAEGIDDHSGGLKIGSDIGRNFIGGNSNGVVLFGGSGTEIRNNYIGLAIDGVTKVPNINNGIEVGNITGAKIGGSNANTGNIISMSATKKGINLSSGTSKYISIRRNMFLPPAVGEYTTISFALGANEGINKPTVTYADTSYAYGTTCNGCIVDLVAGTNFQTTTADGAGNWSIHANLGTVGVGYTSAYFSTKNTVTNNTSGPVDVNITEDSTSPTDLVVTSTTGHSTNTAAYTFTGTKEAYSSVERDGSGWIAVEAGTIWSYPVTLAEGANIFNLCSVDYSNNRSGTGVYTITLDTSAPSAPTLSYASNVSGTTASITVTGEAGTSIYVNNVDTGTNVGNLGNATISVSVINGVSNTYVIKLVDDATNPSPTATATIQGGDPIVYGGGGGGGNNNNNDTVEDTEDTEEDLGEDVLAGEEEAVEENYDEEIEEPTEETAEEEAEEVEETEDTEEGSEEDTEEAEDTEETEEGTEDVTEGYVKPVIATPQQNVVTEQISEDGNQIIIYTEDNESKILEITIDKENVKAKPTFSEVIKTNDINNVIKEAKLGIDVEKVFENLSADQDQDNISDAWEEAYFGDKDFNGEADTDRDGLTDLEEYQYGSNPTNMDSDGDGLSDMTEIYGVGTDPTSWDSDGDSISDVKEIFTGTSPVEFDANKKEIDATVYGAYTDSDSDGVSDYIEEMNDTDPYASDTDGDGLTDGDEIKYNTNPNAVSQVGSLSTTFSNFGSSKKVKSIKTVFMGTSEKNSNVLITVLDLNNQPVLVLEGKTDGNGVFAVYPESEIANGEYKIFVVATDRNDKVKDISPLKEIEVDNTIDVGSIIASKFNGTAFSSNMKSTTSKPKFTATAKPGTIIFGTWKSFVFTSVLMSDSMTGEFTVEAPTDLEEGDHTVYFYPVDPVTGVQGEVMMVNFTVAGATLANDNIRPEETDSSKLPIIIVSVLLIVAGGYIFYRKSSLGRKEEKKLIDKL